MVAVPSDVSLEHYRETPLDFDPHRLYLQEPPYSYHKPRGFWVSVKGEDDWPDWCICNEFRPHCLAHCYEVTLCPKANVHLIDNSADLLAFHGTYSVLDDFAAKYCSRPGDHDLFGNRMQAIDWRKVASDYDGIIIAPYIWSQRLLGPHWYYGWDCASGCIWNLCAVAGVERVDEPEST